jgi:uncharacterized protein (UPF0335 family)
MSYTTSSDLENALREDIKEEETIKSASTLNSEALLDFIKRIENLEEQKKDISEQIKEVFTEVKGVGFDAKIVKIILKLRKKDREEREEEQELLDLYLTALGEDLNE